MSFRFSRLLTRPLIQSPIRCLISLLILGAGASAWAQSELVNAKYFADLKFGYASPTSRADRGAYGADVGMILLNGLTASLYYQTSATSSDGLTEHITHFGLGGDYSLNFILPSWLHGTHGGVRLGLGQLTGGGMNASSHSDLAGGLDLGYDYLIIPELSVGADVTGMWDVGGRAFATIYAMVNVRYIY